MRSGTKKISAENQHGRRKKVTTSNKIIKLYKQNENNGIDKSISPVAVVVT